MRFSAPDILPAAGANGFNAEVVEKVLHLMRLLNALNAHPYLKGKWVLKGGTALNLFVLRHPRLSVDIDLNYVGALERGKMLAARSKMDQAAEAVFSREGFTVRRKLGEHAGGKWRLNYQSYTGRSGSLEVDVNFMFRQPLWDIRHADSHPLGGFRAEGVPLLDLHELVAGKLSALFSRRQARDLFDCHRILDSDRLDHERLRIAFVVYGAMNRKDWRTISIEDVDYDESELARLLTPTLRVRRPPAQEETLAEYGARLLEESRRSLASLLPFTEAEQAFLDLLLDEGEIDATYLTSDTSLQERIRVQPLLEWKAINVRRHKGSS